MGRPIEVGDRDFGLRGHDRALDIVGNRGGKAVALAPPPAATATPTPPAPRLTITAVRWLLLETIPVFAAFTCFGAFILGRLVVAHGAAIRLVPHALRSRATVAAFA